MFVTNILVVDLDDWKHLNNSLGVVNVESCENKRVGLNERIKHSSSHTLNKKKKEIND